MSDQIHKAYSDSLTEEQFKELSEFLYAQYGLKMSQSKKMLLEGRLKPRVVKCGYDNFEHYLSFVFEQDGEELVHMVDAITTNKTEFFREPHHYEFLKEEVATHWGKGQKINLWSAGCSSGEEPYTLTMVLDELEKQKGIDYNVVATDLSTKVLNQAIKAVYPIKSIGLDLNSKRSYFLKNKNPELELMRVVPKLRDKVSFHRLNLVRTPYSFKNDFDLIFFRNVMIYFDRATQFKILLAMCEKLKVGGYMFIGHSESLNGLNLPLKHVKPTIFKRI